MLARIVLVVLVLAVVGGAVVLSQSGEEPTRYEIVFDNAFGATEGVDMRVGGVRAGKVAKLDVERRTARAIVTVEVSEPGIDELTDQAFCEIRPQSLIGEYFVDCEPGKGKALRSGARLPVERTATTIPPDLVANILRRPERERFRILLNELGAGLAARGPELDETIRRAVPALRQTREVLRVLDQNKEQLQAMIRDGDVVLGKLADRREDVVSFVQEARDAASAAADRRTELAATIRNFPEFLRELRPTLADLGTVAEQQTPALRDLRASAGDLETLLARLGPFTEATRPALDSLGEASQTGRRAVAPARTTIARLNDFTENAPELGKNLRIVLDHLNDRSFSVEKNDPDAPAGGYTGLEAFLQYPFDQSQAVNLFDKRGYMLKLQILINECTAYTNAETAKENPERTAKCTGALGPNQPGITTPDPSTDAAITRASADDKRSRSKRTDTATDDDRSSAPRKPRATRTPDASTDRAPSADATREPTATATPGEISPSTVPDQLKETLDQILPGLGESLDKGLAPVLGRSDSSPTGDPQSDAALLDFLLGS